MNPRTQQKLEKVLDQIEDELYDQAELVEPGSPLDHRLAGKQDLARVVRARMGLRRRS